MSIFAALGVVTPAEAAVDYFLEVNGVPGESHDSKFAKSIDVQSYTWGASANSEKKGNKVNLSDLNVSKNVDVASPALFQRLVQGTTIPSVELIGRKAGESQLVFLRYCFQDARVTSIQHAGSGGGGDIRPRTSRSAMGRCPCSTPRRTQRAAAYHRSSLAGTRRPAT